MAGIAKVFSAGVDLRPGKARTIVLPSGETVTVRVVGSRKQKRAILILPVGSKFQSRQKQLTTPA